MALVMLLIHFIKLIYETVRVHRYSGRMISLHLVFWELFMFWFILGGCVGFSLHHTEYMPTSVFADLDYGVMQGNFYKFGVFAVFIIAQIQNFKCKVHFYLCTQAIIAPAHDPSNEAERARHAYINQSLSKLVRLRKHGFAYMTSADVFWEMCVWVSFCAIVNTVFAWTYMVWWAVRHLGKIRKRHERYICEYGYLEDRNYIIPRLI
jgi:hypothetical protein